LAPKLLQELTEPVLYGIYVGFDKSCGSYKGDITITDAMALLGEG
jgi:hypothetical protein